MSTIKYFENLMSSIKENISNITRKLILSGIFFLFLFPVILTNAQCDDTISIYEQYMLELINRARADQDAEAARIGLTGVNGPSNPDDGNGNPNPLITAGPKAPLVFNLKLMTATDKHVVWQDLNDTWSHSQVVATPGFTGVNPWDRMTAEGYTWNNAGENQALTTLTDLTAATLQMHDNLFNDENITGRGHRRNILNEDFREIGLFVGDMSGVNPPGFNTGATQKYASSNSPQSYLTGVVYCDVVEIDNFYTPCEGISDVIVQAYEAGTTNLAATSVTWASGGYNLPLTNGDFDIKFILNGVTNNAGPITIAGNNVKLDETNLLCAIEISCPSDVTLECGASLPSAYTTVEDYLAACDSGTIDSGGICADCLSITHVDTFTSNDPSCVASPSTYYQRVYTLSMGSINSSCTQTFFVVDRTAPVVACPTGITVNCNTSNLPNAATNKASFEALDTVSSITDACGNSVTVTSTNTSDQKTCPETITRTYTITDACGNAVECEQIFVVDLVDLTVVFPTNITVNCLSNIPGPGTNETTFEALDTVSSISDDCTNAVTVTSSDCSDQKTCPETITRTYRITDDCGNITIGKQIITVSNQVAPSMDNCPADVSINWNESSNPTNTGFATAAAGGCNTSVTYLDVVDGCKISRRWWVKDDCDKVSSVCTQTITVVMPDVAGTNYTDSTVAGTCAQEKVITRTWHLWDTCNNIRKTNQVITVVDTNPPAITCPSDTNITLNGCSTNIPDYTSVTVTDNCTAAGTIIVTQSPPVGTTITDQTNQVITLTAKDECGNTNTCSFTVSYLCLASLGDYVWIDADGDGKQDAGETPVPNVTLYLLSNDVIIATNTTDANGKYMFTNLTPGTYSVRMELPDDYLFVTNCPTCVDGCMDCGGCPECVDTDAKKLSSDPSNPWAESDPVTLEAGDNNTNLDFGVTNNPPDTSEAIVKSLKTFFSEPHVFVEFETGSERNTAGFYLQRKMGDGLYARVHSNMIHGMSSRGGVYQVLDPGADALGTNVFQIEEITISGRRFIYGPYRVVAELIDIDFGRSEEVISESSLRRAPYTRREHTLSSNELARIAARSSEREAELELRGWLFGDQIVMCVKETGLYFVSASEIANDLEIPEWYADQLILTGELELRGPKGRVTYRPAPDAQGLMFYARAYGDNYTDENVYVLSWGLNPSPRMVDGGALVEAQPGGYYQATMKYGENQLKIDNQAGTVPEYWKWFELPIAPKYFWEMPRYYENLTVSTPGALSVGADAELTVLVKGGVMHNIHGIDLSWNGSAILSDTFSDFELREFKTNIPAPNLNDGPNTLKILIRKVSGPVPDSIVYVDRASIQYDRRYAASEDQLVFTASNNAPLTVEGFTSSDIYLLDISDPNNPSWIVNTLIDQSALGDWRVSFVPEGNRPYLACAGSTIQSLDLLETRISVDLLNPDTESDYLIITVPELMDEAQRLADYRAGKGLKPRLIDVRDIYSTFSEGRVSPQAIRAFLKYAYEYWNGESRLQYVVFCGDSSGKYFNDPNKMDMIPSSLHKTDYGVIVSDGMLCDVEGDEVPDIAFGRLPVANSEELSNLVNKIIAYENSENGEWISNLLMVGGEENDAGAFHTDINNLYTNVSHIDTNAPLHFFNTTRTANRATLLQRLNAGCSLLNYVGHSGFDAIGYKYLENNDVPNLSNDGMEPVGVLMTCSAGRYGDEGKSISETLLLKPTGGAIAMIAPSGPSVNYTAVFFNEHILQASYRDGVTTIGNILIEAMRRYKNDIRVGIDNAKVLKIYNLLGDPALEIKK